MNAAEYILAHRSDNVQQLALQLHGRPAEEARHILQQIEGWQRLSTKVPTWAATEGLLYPVRLSLEQCSSEQTAQYKAAVAGQGQLLVDLTGGLGVDFSFMAPQFQRATYVERNAELCQLARHNFPLLHLPHATIVEGTAEDYLASTPAEGLREGTVLFLDPFRRDDNGRKTVRIEDCPPNVVDLLPQIFRHAGRAIVKFSPMLDITQALRTLSQALPQIRLAVHIVGTRGEAKEVLIDMQTGSSATPQSLDETRIECHDDHTHFSYTLREEQEALAPLSSSSSVTHADVSADAYLMEPSPVLMKAGCFRLLGVRFRLQALHPNSHLYTSAADCPEFPGRRFRIVRTTTFGKRELRQFMAEAPRNASGQPCANLTVRNFPHTVADLRRRLHLSDGGQEYWFATTLSDGSHRLIACQKL